MDAGALLIAGAVLAPALLSLGSGWLDGDAAAYAVGRWNDRWTHAGYALLLRIVDGDLLSWLATWLAAVGAARIAARAGGDPRLAAAGAAAVLLPWAPFAEVEPCWVAAITWAAASAGAAAAAPIALAVAVSPTALLAVPWVGVRAVVPALVAVVALSVASGGAWWTGERGVLDAAVLLPGRTAGQWALHLPWLLLPGALRDRRWWLLLPLLLAPPDVPAWTLVGLAWAVAGAGSRESGASAQWAAWLVVGQVGLGGLELWRRTERVRAEDAVVRHVVRELGPSDGLVAPWTWGARISVAASGHPYGIRWHPPGRWLRDQEARWCASPPGVVVRLAAVTCATPCGGGEVRCVEVAAPDAW